MVPSIRVYWLLLLGIAIAPLVAMVQSIPTSIFVTLLYDAVVLGLMVIDGLRGRSHRVLVSRELPPRLSIGRDNPVVLVVKSGTSKAQIHIRDYFPVNFGVSRSTLQATVAANSSSELGYTVCPRSRGEFDWGDIQVRQLGAWGLAWDDWKIPQRCQL
ncbi:MAG: DUF58 domain-containing protein, partial [Nostocaceae cyanobacterium]|nr:DUF58 domain-containing protein [Nostocaceae cyanobacterium]